MGLMLYLQVCQYMVGMFAQSYCFWLVMGVDVVGRGGDGEGEKLVVK